jgi:hypothetical protein
LVNDLSMWQASCRLWAVLAENHLRPEELSSRIGADQPRKAKEPFVESSLS